ncbi:hypothetical protein ACIQ9E_11750 [Streptomyces sp. NPDC094448]|uniref:hypothetical protein n=1 Tax=Streptomyces sp. NPDC094448 TaxID=3366063 RepID=UPI00381EE965
MRADPITRRPMALSLVASAAALALAAGAAPALAAQAAGGPGIGIAVTDRQQRGSFTVGAWTDTPGATISKVSAVVRSGSTVVAEVPELTETVPGSGRYQVPADGKLKLTEDGGSIPELGRYTIDVTVDESNGTQVTRANAGTLDFTMRLQAAGLRIAQPTWENRGSTVKGTLVGIQPGSGDQVPLSGRTIDLGLGQFWNDPAPDAAGTVTTGTDGAFSTVVAVGRYKHHVQLRHTMRESGVDDTLYAENYVGSPAARRVDIAATADKKRILPGEKLTVTGRVTHQGAPVAGLAVVADAAARKTTVTTDADGRFTAVLTPAAGASGYPSWSVRPEGPYEDGYAAGALEVPQETTVRPSITLASNGTVTVKGTARVTYATDAHPSDWQPMRLEYSGDKRTWKTLVSTQIYVDSVNWNAFSLTARGGNGYYRLTTSTTQKFLGTSTSPAPLSRISTRLTTANATPEPVKKGATLTVAATLTERSGSTWRPLAQHWATLSFLPKGSTRWSIAGHVRADAKGKAVMKVRAGADGYWRFTYTGSSRHYDAAGASDYVDVR